MLSGCESGDDCKCPETPAQPEPQSALMIDEASAYDEVGNKTSLPLDPRGGEVVVTGEELIIRYESEGVAREVIYSISL